MKTVVRAYGPMYLHRSGQIDGQYLKSYDPNAFDGQGDAVFTHDLKEAMVFVSVEAAVECTMQVPRSRPMRADGLPNRPIRAFTLEYQTMSS